MKVIIIGCDRLGAELAYRLSKHGNEIVIIDKDRTSFVNLHKDFVGRTHEGDALNQEVLLRAGIEEADALVAITQSDTNNFVLGYAAKEMYKVSQVIVRNSDPENQNICEIMGLQAVSSARWGAEQLEEMLIQKEIKTVLTVGGGEVEIVSIRAPKIWAEKNLYEVLTQNQNQLPVVVTRAGKSFIPSKDFICKEGDILHIAADHTGIDALRLMTSGLNEGR